MARYNFKAAIVYCCFSTMFLTVFFTNAQAQKKDFIIYNAIHYKGTPDLSSQGLHKLNLVYEAHLLNSDKSPSTDSIRQVATKFKNEPNVPVTLDIEAWKFSPDELQTTTDRYMQVLDEFKKTNSATPVGFYSVVPQSVIHKWRKMRTTENYDYSNWLNLNNRLKPIADKVDVFFPACYTYTDDTLAWKESVIATISEIKKYNKTKPVYAYVWPQYHGGFPKAIQFVDPAVWRFELETLYPLVDGIVIWTSNRDVDKNIITWDENMPWWRVTKDFIAKHGIK